MGVDDACLLSAIRFKIFSPWGNLSLTAPRINRAQNKPPEEKL
jgi:hypothetical protein